MWDKIILRCTRHVITYPGIKVKHNSEHGESGPKSVLLDMGEEYCVFWQFEIADTYLLFWLSAKVFVLL